MRRLVLEEGFRADGRSISDVRPIWSRAGLLPRTHGSVLFTRGETQVCCVNDMTHGVAESVFSASLLLLLLPLPLHGTPHPLPA